MRFLFIFLFLSFSSTFAQDIPPINIFSTEDYGAENQNWGVSQAPNKFIYVANNKGLLEFNGAAWQLYPTPNETIMRSVKCFENKIFTGFYMNFGFWEKNQFGSLDFTSIIKNSEFQMLEDEQIWEIEELDGWMLFKSLQRIYLYNLNSKDIKIIEGTNDITKLSKVGNIIYFQELGKGVFMIENGQPKLVSNDFLLSENKIVQFFLKDNKLFFLTQKEGFFYLENKSILKWKISADQILENKTVYSAKVLKNGNIVLGTISDGFIKLFQNGDIYYQITQGLGLSNNTILSIFEDVDDNIWLGLDNGINTINLKSPFKSFVKKENFWGTIYASIIYRGNLYLGTNQGLYYRAINSNERFKFVKETQGQVWDLQEIDNTLFCSHDSGTFVIINKNAKLINGTSGTWGVKKIDDNAILQGSYDGLYVLIKKNNSWSIRNKIKGFSNSSRYFIIRNETTVFVNHEYKGVFKLDIDRDFRNVVKVERDESVEKGIHSSLTEYEGDIYYACKKGVYKYLEEIKAFKFDSIFSNLMPEGEFLSAKLINDNVNNKLWSFTKDDIRYFSPGKFSNKPNLEIIPIKGGLHLGASGYENLIYLKDKQYLIGTADGYLVVDLNKIKKAKDFNVSINKILNNETDEFKRKVSLNGKGIFDVTENNIEYHYSVSNYNKTSSIKYQYKLEGLNEKWSRLYENNSVLYENLPSGYYVFKVRASIDNKLSNNIAEHSFQISKAWYLADFFIGIYIILIMLSLYLIHVASKRYYKKQREDLLEKAQKEIELKELESSQKIIKINNDKLRVDIESKNRELATSTMSIIKKNEFLSSIKSELISDGKNGVEKVVRIIDKNLNNTDDWKMFQEAFNNADKKFLKKIKSKHAELTP
ncbi:MAG: triple tyrosine motif-containing protein, partial [Polaribacter sp.]|nr:triple tyrosine motif-containing protein [Polaribacter sp.]